MTTEWNVKVPMRDGTLLAADVWRGADGERRTTLVARTPYNKNTAEQQERAAAYAVHGYNFVDMDVRGRGDSDGSFEPWRSEGQDGYDTIEWIAEQDWSDGNVVTWGQSYLGCIQWMTALEQPPHLRGMIVYVAPSDPFEDNPTGVPIPWEICWFRMLDGRVRQFVDLVDWPQVAWHLPLLDLDIHAGFRSEHWRRFLTTPITDREYWDPVRYQPRITEVTVPVLSITGWYDDVQRGSTAQLHAADRAAGARGSTGEPVAGRRALGSPVHPDPQSSARRHRLRPGCGNGPAGAGAGLAGLSAAPAGRAACRPCGFS